MLEIKASSAYEAPKIVVMGIGGGGNNAINRMVEGNNFAVTYVAVNTDKMVLDRSQANVLLPIGEKLTGGYGAGGDPTIGAASAEESTDEIEEIIKGAQLVILTAGMGGGTGTGAIPAIAKICQNQHILTVAVVTKPFSFESRKRMEIATVGIAQLKECVDTLLVIPNDKLLEMNDQTMDIEDAFVMADTVLQNAIQAITNIIMECGTVNLDFNDLRTVLTKKGLAHLGISIQTAGTDVMKAVTEALDSPLLETNIRGAKYVLINISGKTNLLQLNAAIKKVQETAGEECYIMWGTVKSAKENDSIVVTIIATGLVDPEAEPVDNTSTNIGTGGNAATIAEPVTRITPTEFRTPMARKTIAPTVAPRKLEIPAFLQGEKKE